MVKNVKGCVMKNNILKSNELLIPTISFDSLGGWFADTEFLLTEGVCYLMAHGLGNVVENAKTTFDSDVTGIFHVYVYTYNWVAPWHNDMYPGLFRTVINDKEGEISGHTEHWGWEDCGIANIKKGKNTLELEDLTGFEGRCAFVLVTKNNDISSLPSGPKKIMEFYLNSCIDEDETKTINTEFAVIGGGFAGMCSALAAARSGVKTILVQDRLVVGGNNSSEVRVWLGGGTNYEPFAGLGNIVGEFEQKEIGHYGSVNQAKLYEDEKKLSILEKEKNLTLLLGHIMIDSEVDGSRIVSATLLDYRNNRLVKIEAPLFTDATGDGNLAAMSGADYEVTTNGHMGASNLWHIKKTGIDKPFKRCPWAVDLSSVAFPGRADIKDIYGHEREFSLGCWFWESGMTEDPIEKAEYARDMNFRAMYGAWDTLKNVDNDYKGYELAFSAAIAGKRESRRILGDLVLTKADFKYTFPDACVATTWNFDVHYPDKRFYSAFHEGDAFLTMDCREVFQGPYFLPYRILYSRNIDNLFVAGRCVSVSHDASGTARVMRTCGIMGEVVGYAAMVCKKYSCAPRAVYREHLEEFLSYLKSIDKKEVHKVGNTVV